MATITQLIEKVGEGDRAAANELLVATYDELRRLALAKMSRENPGHTLQATALVHEAYVRLVRGQERNWQDRGQFFRSAAEAMRRILVDAARQKARVKRGGDRRRCELREDDAVASPTSIDLLALDEALEKLTKEEPAKAELVKLRYFAGLPLEEAAELLGLSRATAARHWAYARAWLFYEMSKGEEFAPQAPES